jgi:endoglucanase
MAKKHHPFWQHFISYIMAFALVFGILVIAVLFIYMSKPAKQTNQPSPPQTSPTVKQTSKLYGVNMSGAEFGEDHIPGILNQDYIYPHDDATYGYFQSKNITLIRLPIRWERVQHAAFGPLEDTDIAEIQYIIAIANQHNQQVIIDLHNFGRYYNNALTTEDGSKFADIWRKLAIALKDTPGLYGYELMNEPHDLPGNDETWSALAQKATDNIRQIDIRHVILVPGYNWQNSQNWSQNNDNLQVDDPQNKLIYSGHIYFDNSYRGDYKQAFDPNNDKTTVGVTESENFRQWLRDHHAKGMFTEYGVPSDDPNWLQTMDTFLEDISKDPDILGAVYWSAGPWWGNYPLSIEPVNGQDRPQMQILQKYTL